jgi:Ferritin-like
MANKITNRSQLIYALTEIAQLEQTLMCQYLFAAVSIKTSVQELTNKERCFHQIELMREWKKQILRVAREEMQHLTYAINLLVSVGGSPNFTRPNFPNYNRFYKSGPDSHGLLMSLEKFSIDTIDRFIQFEAPPPPPEKLEFIAAIPEPNYYSTLHEFYDSIREAFTEEMFVDYKHQYDPLDETDSVRLQYRRPINNIVKNIKEAKALIDMIVEEGEGSTGKDPQAHVNIFRIIRKELQEEIKSDPFFEPARPVLSNPMTRIHDDMEENLEKQIAVVGKDVQDGLPNNLLQLFGSVYEILLTWLFQVFDRHGSVKELKAIESLAFMPYMSEIVRPVMEFLTRVPVKLNDREGNLGPGFEMTSNNLQIPKPEITHKITIERLTEMVALSETIFAQLKTTHGDESPLITDFSFILNSIKILHEEFRNRVSHGWPATDPDASKSEDPKATVGGWTLRGPDILEIKFEGWFQARLASDPDGANEKRGITGNNFAVGDEPDLDRVIHFQSKDAITRSHCPQIGVTVTSAQIISAPIGLRNIVKDVSSFIGAAVNLLDNPKFEGRNHMVSDDGEPIDPFVLQIESKDGIRLTRAVIGNGEINEMTPAQRAGCGRYVIGGGASIDAISLYLTKIGKYKTPHEYLHERIRLLNEDLLKMPPEHKLCSESEAIKFRLKCLEEARLSSIGVPMPGGVRWSRYFFFVDYLHTISAKPGIFLNGIDLGFKFREGSPQDIRAKWLIDYHMGFFDSDALSAYTYGTLQIPINLG